MKGSFPFFVILLFLFGIFFIYGCADDVDSTDAQGSDGDSDTDTDTDSDADGDDVDCAGVVGGDALADACGVCEGDGATCDCSAGSYCAEMVDAHNQVRNAINAGTFEGQPAPSTPMPEVTWDSLLAQVALNWASGCTWNHNDNRTSDYKALGGTGYVGENMSSQWGGGGAPDAESIVIGQWCSEVSKYNYSDNSCSGTCGHYTQVAWAKTTRIGCATVDCSASDNGWITVCNYAPGGNFNGESPY